jgi:hypothetical protein
LYWLIQLQSSVSQHKVLSVAFFIGGIPVASFSMARNVAISFDPHCLGSAHCPGSAHRLAIWFWYGGLLWFPDGAHLHGWWMNMPSDHLACWICTLALLAGFIAWWSC